MEVDSKTKWCYYWDQLVNEVMNEDQYDFSKLLCGIYISNAHFSATPVLLGGE